MLVLAVQKYEEGAETERPRSFRMEKWTVLLSARQNEKKIAEKSHLVDSNRNFLNIDQWLLATNAQKNQEERMN